MTDETPTDPATRAIPLWLVLFGLAPAVWMMTCGYFLFPINIHPESPDYPRWKLDLIFSGMLIIEFFWAFVVLRKVEVHWSFRIPVIILVAVIAHVVNVMVAMAGCGVFEGLGSLVE